MERVVGMLADGRMAHLEYSEAFKIIFGYFSNNFAHVIYKQTAIQTGGCGYLWNNLMG